MGRLGLYEYPEIGIDEAIKIIEKVRFSDPLFSHEEELQDEFHAEETPDEDLEEDSETKVNKLARLIGHSSSNSGTFRDKITALRRYGLLEEYSYDLTPISETILNPPSEEDLQIALVEARDNIKLFEKLVEARIDLANDIEAEAIIRNACQVLKKNGDRKVTKLLGIMRGFANRIDKQHWYGRFIDDEKLQKNLKRLENPRLAETASAAIWAQFDHKPTTPFQILRVFDALQKSDDDRIRFHLLKAIRDGLRRLPIKDDGVNKISDYLVEKIIIPNYPKDRHDKAVRTAEVAIETLAYLETERNYDKLLRCMFDICKANEIFNDYYMEPGGDRDGRPSILLSYLAYTNKDKLVDAIWNEIDKHGEEYQHRKLERLLERIGEVKIWE